jgi:hypothetical protein
MILVRGLVWDVWNKEHIARHGVSPDEVEEVCHSRYQAIESFRGRVQLTGKTKKEKRLTIILSSEDRALKSYEDGMYYPITAFEEVIEV